MQAIKNEIERRMLNMDNSTFLRYDNPKRIVLSSILDELVHNIDFQQRKVKKKFETFQAYSTERYFSDLACKVYHDWNIAKAALTRLQQRYRIVLEMLATL